MPPSGDEGERIDVPSECRDLRLDAVERIEVALDLVAGQRRGGNREYVEPTTGPRELFDDLSVCQTTPEVAQQRISNVAFGEIPIEDGCVIVCGSERHECETVGNLIAGM
ncbi:MAG TPA: hypothetical protein VEU30_14855 [Thermoanaerobaculia bacterium]|nr:hypothetical protein [Thermoanaerobaculia bacterium]